MVKSGLSILAVMLVLGVGAALATDAPETAAAAPQASAETPGTEAGGSCDVDPAADASRFAGEIEGIHYSYIEICSCRTDADCDAVCGEGGGVCKVLNTVACPPPLPAGSCLCGAAQPIPR
jgi:hypothetical protein